MDFSLATQFLRYSGSPRYRTMMPAPSTVGALATALLLSSMGWASARQQNPAATAPPPPAQQQPDQQAPAQVEHPAQASVPGPNEATGAAPLRVMVPKSLLINTTQPLNPCPA